MSVRIGSKLRHPTLDKVAKLIEISPFKYKTWIDNRFVDGCDVVLAFDELIPHIEKSKHIEGVGDVSILVIHSGYLNRLEVVDG